MIHRLGWPRRDDGSFCINCVISAQSRPTRPGDPDRFFPGHTPRSTDSVHTRHRPHALSSCTARRRPSRNWCRRHYCRSIARTMDGRSQQSWETQRERRPARKMRATNDKPSVSFKSPWFVSLTQRRWNCLVPVKTTLRSPDRLMPARAHPAVSSSMMTLKAHRHALALFVAYAKGGDTAELHGWAGQTLPQSQGARAVTNIPGRTIVRLLP